VQLQPLRGKGLADNRYNSKNNNGREETLLETNLTYKATKPLALQLIEIVVSQFAAGR
jgi:hypothetical protein